MWHMLQQVFGELEPALVAYGALALFIIVYLESFGAPLPGESALVAAAALASRGDLSIISVIAAAWFGSVLGDTTGYAIGRSGGHALLQRFGPRLGVSPEKLEHYSRLFRERGFPIVVGARFVVVLRQINGLVAGSVAMPFPRFLLANILGATLWSFAWALGSYLLGSSLHL